jgi:hypothetical protein
MLCEQFRRLCTEHFKEVAFSTEHHQRAATAELVVNIEVVGVGADCLPSLLGPSFSDSCFAVISVRWQVAARNGKVLARQVVKGSSPEGARTAGSALRLAMDDLRQRNVEFLKSRKARRTFGEARTR